MRGGKRVASCPFEEGRFSGSRRGGGRVAPPLPKGGTTFGEGASGFGIRAAKRAATTGGESRSPPRVVQGGAAPRTRNPGCPGEGPESGAPHAPSPGTPPRPLLSRSPPSLPPAPEAPRGVPPSRMGRGDPAGRRPRPPPGAVPCRRRARGPGARSPRRRPRLLETDRARAEGRSEEDLSRGGGDRPGAGRGEDPRGRVGGEARADLAGCAGSGRDPPRRAVPRPGARSPRAGGRDPEARSPAAPRRDPPLPPRRLLPRGSGDGAALPPGGAPGREPATVGEVSALGSPPRERPARPPHRVGPAGNRLEGRGPRARGAPARRRSGPFTGPRSRNGRAPSRSRRRGASPAPDPPRPRARRGAPKRDRRSSRGRR